MCPSRHDHQQVATEPGHRMQSSIKSSPYVVPGGGDVSCDRVRPRMVCFHTSGPSTRVTASIACVSARTLIFRSSAHTLRHTSSCRRRPDQPPRLVLQLSMPAATVPASLLTNHFTLPHITHCSDIVLQTRSRHCKQADSSPPRRQAPRGKSPGGQCTAPRPRACARSPPESAAVPARRHAG